MKVGVGGQLGHDQEEPTTLYALYCGGNIKIGIAADVVERMGYIQKACPLPIECVAQLHFATRTLAREAEKRLHAKFASERLWGEWFSIDRVDALAAILEEADAAPAFEPQPRSKRIPLLPGEVTPTAHLWRQHNPWSAWDTLSAEERERRIARATRCLSPLPTI